MYHKAVENIFADHMSEEYKEKFSHVKMCVKMNKDT